MTKTPDIRATLAQDRFRGMRTRLRVLTPKCNELWRFAKGSRARLAENASSAGFTPFYGWSVRGIGATNERAIDNSPWLQICPWGEFDNQVGLQRVARDQGETMVTAFNSLLGRMGRLFRGVPVFVGHPDVDPNKYPDKRRYGKITAMEAREDGLYSKVAWNDLGQQNLKEGYYLYPSPVWVLKRRPGGIVEPCELISVGLTNFPNIQKVQPWALNCRGSRPLARNSRSLDRFYRLPGGGQRNPNPKNP
jgi:hypothetical protein